MNAREARQESLCHKDSIPNKSVGIRIAFIGIAVAIIALGYFIPTPEGLQFEGKMALVILIAGLFLWITEPIPIPISGFFLMVLLPVFNILNIGEVWTGFISSVVFFIIASFGITAAVTNTRIPRLAIGALVKKSHGNGKRIIAGFMFATAIMSIFLSDLPVCALSVGCALAILKHEENETTGKSRFGKALMISIPMASVIGGYISPAGSALNVLCNNLLKDQFGYEIPFLFWMIIVLPLAIITLFVIYFCLVKIIKPGNISESAYKQSVADYEAAGKLDSHDFKVLAVVLSVVALWIISTWTHWDATAIALIGLGALFLPGIDALTWKTFKDAVVWETVLFIGTVQSIASGVVNRGAATWFVNSTLLSVGGGAFGLLAGTAVLSPFIRIFVPAGSAFIFITLVPLLEAAMSLGISPAVFTIIIAYAASCNLILAVDPLTMISYTHRWFTIRDFFVVGIIPTIVMIVMQITLLPLLCGAFGL